MSFKDRGSGSVTKSTVKLYNSVQYKTEKAWCCVFRFELCKRLMHQAGRGNGIFPAAVLRRIFEKLNAVDLARAGAVCAAWNEAGRCAGLWEGLCIARWRALRTDDAVWEALDGGLEADDEGRWRKGFPAVGTGRLWCMRLMEGRKVVCRVKMHHLCGKRVERVRLSTVVVERYFLEGILFEFVGKEATVYYVEGADEEEDEAFNEFVKGLYERKECGVGIWDCWRFMFVKGNGDKFLRETFGYIGNGLLCVFQDVGELGRLCVVDEEV